MAAAQATYRLTELPSFDPALKFELRKRAAEILGRVAGLGLAPNPVFRHRGQLEDLYAALAAMIELVDFALDMKLVSPENARKVIAAYGAIRESLAWPAGAGDRERPEVICLSRIPASLSSGVNLVRGGASNEMNGDKQIPSVINVRASRSEPAVSEEGTDLNRRQKRILWYLKHADQAQIGDIRLLFGEEASERSLQRDLLNLVSAGFIRREGDYRWSTYAYIPSPRGDAAIAEVLAEESADDSDPNGGLAYGAEMQ